jgi:hypothetical protein
MAIGVCADEIAVAAVGRQIATLGYTGAAAETERRATREHRQGGERQARWSDYRHPRSHDSQDSPGLQPGHEGTTIRDRVVDYYWPDGRA